MLSVLADFAEEPVHEERTASTIRLLKATLPDEDEFRRLRWTSGSFRESALFPSSVCCGRCTRRTSFLSSENAGGCL
jgi:hypothetical protein